MYPLYKAGSKTPITKLHEAHGFNKIRGLIGRSDWPVEDALLFNDCKQVHTWFMQFSIGIIFLNDHKQVVGHAHLKPFSFSPKINKAKYIIEYRMGNTELAQIKKGEYLNWY